MSKIIPNIIHYNNFKLNILKAMNNDYIDKEQPQKKQTKKYLTTLNHFIK